MIHGWIVGNREQPRISAFTTKVVQRRAIALFIGLGPIFILCLIFKATESMFWRWLNYGLGTLFSMAVLSFMVSMVLDLTLRVAGALWAANAISDLFNVQGASGLTSQAMQQGGIGLLMTTLLITAPAMAASFFGGTLGQFQSFSQMGGAVQLGSQGPQGQAPGGYAPQSSSAHAADGARTSTGGFNNVAGARTASSSPSATADTIKVDLPTVRI